MPPPLDCTILWSASALHYPRRGRGVGGGGGGGGKLSRNISVRPPTLPGHHPLRFFHFSFLKISVNPCKTWPHILVDYFRHLRDPHAKLRSRRAVRRHPSAGRGHRAGASASRTTGLCDVHPGHHARCVPIGFVASFLSREADLGHLFVAFMKSAVGYCCAILIF